MKSKNKHDHRLTNFLKVFIFMLVMLAPFLAVSTSCITTYWNETIEMPSQEVIENQPIQTNTVNTSDDLIVGNIYDFKIKINYIDTEINYFKATKIYNIANDTKKINIDAESTNNTYLILRERLAYFVAVTSNNQTFSLVDYNNKNQLEDITIQFIYYGDFNADYISQVSAATWIPQGSYEIIEHTSEDIDIFYYAVDNLENKNIFSWTKQTAIYRGLNAMTDGLGLENNTLAVLLTYWTIITSIYIIIDIVLEMFIFLTHWLNDKIC